MSVITFNIRDHSDEYSGVGINIPDVDEVSWVATNTAIGVIQAAILGLTTGNLASRTLQAYKQTVDDTRPANPYAQRELGLRLFYSDDVTGKKYHITVPCPDLTIVGVGGSDEIDMTLSAAQALITALEALMVSPEGNGVDIYRGVIVGRKN